MQNARTNAGFTLIELMIVVVIIGIIASIAIPNYSAYVLKAKRSEARSALLDAGAKLERYYSDNNVYAKQANTVPSPGGRPVFRGKSETDLYNVTLTIAAPFQAFTLTATPTFPDKGCSCYTYTNTGIKGNRACASGPSRSAPTMSVADCW